MGQLKTAALGVGAVAAAGIAVLLAVAAFRPDHFRVERRTVVQAPAARLQALIGDMREFNTWNPYTRKDPQLQASYEGPPAGPGATFRFAGPRSGSGTLRITDVQPLQVNMLLQMTAPLEGRNDVRFTLVPQPAGGTEVAWTMEGPSPYVSRVLGLVFNLDTMIGTDFETGLAALKARAERT